MSGWREETGVATWIAWGECGANDGRTGLVSGLWYLLDVIDGEQRGRRRGGKGEESGESFLCLHMYFILLFLGNYFVTFLPCKYGGRKGYIEVFARTCVVGVI